MALFKKKTEDTKPENAVAEAPKQATSVNIVNRAGVLVRPRITEKAVMASEKGVYVFEVRSGASKHEIAAAVKDAFGVTPVKIRTVTKKPRTFMSRARGRKISEKGLKKAYVYLKKGETISLV